MTAKDKKNVQYGIAAVAIIGAVYAFMPKTESGGGFIDPTGNGSTAPGGVPQTVFSATKVAAELYEAMRTSGTDEDAIVSILTPVTQTQFGAVFTAFKAKQYNKTLGNQINPFPWTELPYYNLKSWLQNELSAAEYAILKLKYPNYL